MSASAIPTANAVQDEVFLTTDLTGALSLTSATDLHLSLHSSWPGLSGSQTVNEVSYTGYSRVPVARSASGWTRDSLPVGLSPNTKNANGVSWPPCTGGTATAKWVGIGAAASGTGKLLWSLPIVASGVNWVVAITNIRATAGTTANWVTIAGYRLGSDVFAEGDEVAVLRNYEESMHTNLLETTAYFVANTTLEGTWPDAISFQLATVSGAGAVVDISPGDNRCSALRMVPLSSLSISSGVIPTLPTLGAVLYGV